MALGEEQWSSSGWRWGPERLTSYLESSACQMVHFRAGPGGGGGGQCPIAPRHTETREEGGLACSSGS